LAERSLQIRFDTPAKLCAEFEKNIVNRGIFVATDEAFEIREPLLVEIVLSYVDDQKIALCLDGEVVHCIPVGMAASGAVPGIAIQFDASPAEIREVFAPLLGEAVPEQLDRDAEGAGRRSAKRGSVRVPVRVMPSMSPPFEATSRDVSASGILLTVRESALPIGETVRTCLWHPSGESSIEIDGRVVRHVRNKHGRVAAVAVAFDRDQAEDPRTRAVLDELRQAGHRNRLGGISGSISELGLANILQMFGVAATQGTVVVDHDGDQGWVAFAEGQLLGAVLGAKTGQTALVEMLDWDEGRFQFEATVDAKLRESAKRRPLAAAVFEAVRVLDERNRNEETSSAAASSSIRSETTFLVDSDQEAATGSSIDKVEQAVLDLARAGMPVHRLKAIIPESDERIQSALEGLVESGVLVPR
jgi:Tfp pilus assembly protein PilZ